MNNWNFTGNLGAAAEQRVTPSGEPVVSFSVAVKSGFGYKATTTWARCSMFGNRGTAVSEFLTKGQLVGVCGEVTLREYDKKDGSKGASLEVRVNDLTLLGKRDTDTQYSAPAAQPRQAAPARPQQSGSSQGGFGDFGDDDVPFLRHGHGATWRVL